MAAGQYLPRLAFSLVNSAGFMPSHIFLAYSLMYFVIPKYLLKEKYIISAVMTVLIFTVGYYVDHVQMSPTGYAFGLLMSMLGGAVYLGMGQAIVGRIKNPDTVNSTTRLVYFVFILIGMFGEFGVLGKQIALAVVWSPYGVVRKVVAASLDPSTWQLETTYALLAAVAYTVLFVVLGVKWFKWESR